MPAHTDTALLMLACIVASVSALGIVGIALLLVLYRKAHRTPRPPLGYAVSARDGRHDGVGQPGPRSLP